MKDLTNEEKATLLSKIKSFLDVTWTDTNTDNKIWDYAVQSIFFIDDTCGHELDYLCDVSSSSTTDQYKALCECGISLMLNRVFYMWQKALDDFAKNYAAELNRLYFLGKIYTEEDEEEEEDAE